MYYIRTQWSRIAVTSLEESMFDGRDMNNVYKYQIIFRTPISFPTNTNSFDIVVLDEFSHYRYTINGVNWGSGSSNISIWFNTITLHARMIIYGTFVGM